MSNELLFRIRKVRLINFHNFVDETITVPNGGHLFLLGDNGSGKTTLLDAIHLVLTANEEVEFNAAARVTGSSRDGRRLQGIIMRQNIELSAPLNPQGGITYAALEIENRQGKPLSLVLGLRAQAMDDRVHYWGMIRPCPLDEIKLYREVAGERYPMSRRELRDMQEEKHFFADLKSFRGALIRQLYGNEDLFKESCRLLRMGKAYREIAAGTSDYHELFKKLLPDPQRELFERVIRTLRELEQSTLDLAGLEEKQGYLVSLDKIINSITQFREAKLRYQWLIHYLKSAALTDDMAAVKTQQEAIAAELAQCRQEISDAETKLDALQRDLHVLQQADDSGLLNLQRERTREELLLHTECERLQAAVKIREQEQSSAKRAIRNAMVDWQFALKKIYDTFHRLRNTEDTFSLNELLGEIDALMRCEDIRDAREIEVAALSEMLHDKIEKLISDKSEATQSLIEQQEKLQGISTEIADLAAQQGLSPKITGFREARLALERQMISANPLYLALEWKAGLSATSRSAIEEAIGVEVLATLLVAEQDFAQASRIIFPDFPGIRLANCDVGHEDVPRWISESFDISTSDPAAIRILAEEMLARTHQHPIVENQQGANILHFRSHQHRLIGAMAQLIGAESRNDAMRQQLKILHEAEKLCGREIRAFEKTISSINERKSRYELITRELNAAPLTIAKVRHQALDTLSRYDEAEQRFIHQQQTADEAGSRWQSCKEQLADLHARIAREGLDKLEEKLRKVTRDISNRKEECDKLHKSEGVHEERIAEQDRQYSKLQAAALYEANELRHFEEVLSRHAEAVESVAYYVLRTWRGQQFSRVENVQDELERSGREEAEAIGGLRRDINHPTYGALYAFTYNEAENSLHDRYMSKISDVVVAGQQQVDEQHEIINERTQELIRNIIMGDLFTELKGSVSRLRAMAKKINNLLDRRIFGSNGYRFRLEQERHYHDLLEVIEKYNPLDPLAQDELKHFLAVHKDEIMATEVNDIPAALDYRNWFQYELAMVSENNQGEKLIDRKTKILGSGGEQAVPNYLLILMVAHFLYDGNNELRHRALLFDEAFYGIDAGRRDQLLGFASDLQLQLFIASPDLDGVKQEIPSSTTLLVVKDESCNVHLFPYDFSNPHQLSLLEEASDPASAEFAAEIGSDNA